MLLITVYAFLSEVLHASLAFMHINNHWQGSLSPLLDYVLSTMAIARMMNRKLINTPVILLSAVYFLCAWAEFSIHGVERGYAFTDTYGNLLRMGIGLYAFYDLMETPQGTDLSRVPLFYFNTGLFVYCAGNLFLDAMFQKLVQVFPLALLVHAPLSIFFYLMLTKSMLCIVQTKS